MTNVKQACGKSEDGTRPPPQPPITSTPTAVQGLRSSSRSHPPSPLPARSSCRGGVWRDTAGSPVSPPESSPARTEITCSRSGLTGSQPHGRGGKGRWGTLDGETPALGDAVCAS